MTSGTSDKNTETVTSGTSDKNTETSKTYNVFFVPWMCSDTYVAQQIRDVTGLPHAVAGKMGCIDAGQGKRGKNLSKTTVFGFCSGFPS